MWDEFSYPQLLLLRGLSDQRRKNESLDVWVCLGANPWTCPEPLIGRVKECILNNPPCPITPRSRHHLYIIHLIKSPHCFHHITMSPKWQLVPKRNVKQQLTPTPLSSSPPPSSYSSSSPPSPPPPPPLLPPPPRLLPPPPSIFSSPVPVHPLPSSPPLTPNFTPPPPTHHFLLLYHLPLLISVSRRL